MPTPPRPRRRKNPSFEKENKSPNIGELKPSKRKLKLNVRTLTRQEQEERRKAGKQPSGEDRGNEQWHHHGPLSGRDPMRDQQKGSKKTEKRPAYAFKSATSHLLEISERPPQPHDIEMGSVDGDKAKFYTIAINDGAVGLHTGANFGKNGFNVMSHNTHRSNWTAVNPIVSFPWNEGEGTFSNEKKNAREAKIAQKDFENNADADKSDTDDDNSPYSKSSGPYVEAKLHPWKEWEDRKSVV